MMLRHLLPHIGNLPQGLGNAITDVAGVTVVRPHAGDPFRDRVPAAAAVLNGFGKSVGLLQIEELGEAGIYGALAGEYGVPVVMASGDDVFIEEHRPVFPHATFVQTKRAAGQTSGVSLSPAQDCSAIREGVAAALARHSMARPFVLAAPIAVRIQTPTPALADLFCQWPTLRRLDGDEVDFDAPRWRLLCA